MIIPIKYKPFVYKPLTKPIVLKPYKYIPKSSHPWKCYGGGSSTGKYSSGSISCMKKINNKWTVYAGGRGFKVPGATKLTGTGGIGYTKNLNKNWSVTTGLHGQTGHGGTKATYGGIRLTYKR